MQTRDFIVRLIISAGFIALLQCLSITASAQWLQGNDNTISSGSYNDLGWNGTLTVTGTVTANSMTSGNGKLVIENGAVVTVSGNVQRGSILVKTGGKLIVNGTFTMKDAEIQTNSIVNAKILDITNAPAKIGGTIIVSEKTTFHNGPILFSDCGFLSTKNLDNWSAPNVVQGSGLIVVTGQFNGSNPLTSSNTILFNFTGTGNGKKGAAMISTQTNSLCASLPIKFKSFSVRRVN